MTAKPKDWDAAKRAGQDPIRIADAEWAKRSNRVIEQDKLAAANGEHVEPRQPIAATPYVWRDPATMPPRAFLFRRHYIRGAVSATVAPGGVGKTSLALAEAVAMPLASDFLGELPSQRLRVWYISGEDTREEIERRVAAVCQYHGLDAHALAGWLFIDSAIERPIKLAASAGGANVKFDDLSLAEMLKQIEAHQIDVVMLDPFVAFHTVPENDNTMIDQVVKRIARVAQITDASIEIVHHVRKPAQGQAELTTDDARGGSAIINAVRSARVLNRMSATEATAARVEGVDRRAYFRIDKGKHNMSPPEAATWARLVSVIIGNHDNVGAVAPWQFPSAFDAVSAAHMHRFREIVAAKEYRASSQSKEWAGLALADLLGLNPENDADRAQIKQILKTWCRNKVLAVETRRTPQRKWRDFIVAGPWNDTQNNDAPLED